MAGFLFIVGQGRSGTTALARVVGSHFRVVLGVERFKFLWNKKGLERLNPAQFAEHRFFDFESARFTNLTPDVPKWATYYENARTKYADARYVGDKMTAVWGAISHGTPVITTDYATAELVKASANAFLATKISFINAVAEVCEVTGADVTALADALGHDVRIGRKFLNAGIGYGGGCLPKDIRAFLHRAGELGVDDAMGFLRAIDGINLSRRDKMVQMATAMVSDVRSSRIAILGAAFKPHSDDIRDSPALWVAGQLQLAGAHVSVYDPKAMDNARRLYPTLGYSDSALAACAEADVVLHLTEWPEFRELKPTDLDGVVRERRMIDGRNCLDRAMWRDAGWSIRSMGRP